jgi:hypothetical protein
LRLERPKLPSKALMKWHGEGGIAAPARVAGAAGREIREG